MQHHRGRSKRPEHRLPESYLATAPWLRKLADNSRDEGNEKIIIQVPLPKKNAIIIIEIVLSKSDAIIVFRLKVA